MGQDAFTAALLQAQQQFNQLANYIAQAPGVINPILTGQPSVQPAFFDTYNQGSLSGGAGVLLVLGLVVIGLLVLR